ncbi:MAG TPA: aldolase/citrate lyase family protein [Bauldia sp.]|nr:aldolase/citrate lyase family protein [Bauldia sp.]
MRTNPMRAGVERGEAQIGTWLTMIENPAVLRLMQAAGIDFARVDIEHTGFSIETIGRLAGMARALDFPIAVRPPIANREWITRLLDIGVWNLHCPQVESAAHAAEIVAAAYYAPRGQRGMGGLGPATDFETFASVREQCEAANRQVFITVMLETSKAFDDLDAIAATEGIDALTIGPHDLAQNLGIFGQPDQTRILDEKRELMLAAARRHGKTCAMLVSSAEQADKWRAAGALLLAYSSDTEVLSSGFRSAMQRLKGRAAPPRAS